MGSQSSDNTRVVQRAATADRLFRALGFRWVFPIGTLPVPFHPLLALVLLLAAPLWLAASLALSGEGTGGQVTWLQMLLVGLLTGVPLSIPIVAWLAMVSRGPLVQGLFFASAMTLLATEAARGREDAGWALVPAVYLLVWLVQWLGGRMLLRRWQRQLAGFAPIEAGVRPVVVEWRRLPAAEQLVAEGYAMRSYAASSQPGARGRLVERIAAADAAEIGAMLEGRPPPAWSVRQGRSGWILSRPADPPEGACIALDARPWRGAARTAGLARGDLLVWRIDDGDGPRELVTGTARVVSPLPLATLFHWTAVFGGRSRWVVGFARREVRLTDYQADGVLGLFTPVAGEPGPSSALVAEAHAAVAAFRRAEDERRRQRQADARRAVRQRPKAVHASGRGTARDVTTRERASVADLWAAVAGNPAAWAGYEDAYRRALELGPDLGREDLSRTLDWLDAALAARARGGATRAARLIAAMGEGVLAGDRDRLAATFNSRVLGMVWRITPDFDPAPLPARVPLFGDEAGYGLVRDVPELYLKLARLDPDMERLAAGLAAEALRYGIALPDALAAMAAPPSATG